MCWQHIFAGHNLINNAALLAEAGLGYPVCVGGSFEIRGGERLCFRPFAPRRTTGQVLAIVDPELMVSVPPKFTAYQSFDTLFHATEVYIGRAANLMTDMVALASIENVGRYLARAICPDGPGIGQSGCRHAPGLYPGSG